MVVVDWGLNQRTTPVAARWGRTSMGGASKVWEGGVGARGAGWLGGARGRTPLRSGGASGQKGRRNSAQFALHVQRLQHGVVQQMLRERLLEPVGEMPILHGQSATCSVTELKTIIQTATQE